MARRKTHEEFVKEVYDLVGEEFIVAGTYKSAKTNIDFRHNVEECHHEFQMTPTNFLNRKRCPKCSQKLIGNKVKNHSTFLLEVFNCVGNEYSVLEEYAYSDVKIWFVHNKSNCQYKFKMKPNSFLQGQRCPKCAGNVKKSTDEFKKEVSDLTNGEYIVLEDYINAHTLIPIKHLDCNSEYRVTPNHFLQGNRCPRCNESKGEKKIGSWLEKYQINYDSQK